MEQYFPRKFSLFPLMFGFTNYTPILLLCFQITQFLESQGFLDYLERCIGSDESNNNILDKLQDAIGRGQNPLSILPPLVEPEIITISDPDLGTSGKEHINFKLNGVRIITEHAYSIS